jgi:hypothetical protein
MPFLDFSGAPLIGDGFSHDYFLRKAADRSYTGEIGATTFASIAPVGDVLYAYPFFNGNASQVVNFNVYVFAGAAGTIRCGIYDNDQLTNPYPVNLLADSGDMVAGVGHATSVVGLPVTLDANSLYWLACVNSLGTLRQFSSLTTLRRNMAAIFSYPLAASWNAPRECPAFLLSIAQAYGALPATFPAGATITETGTVAVPYVGITLSP